VYSRRERLSEEAAGKRDRIRKSWEEVTDLADWRRGWWDWET
jgi:hypothetical protein